MGEQKIKKTVLQIFSYLWTVFSIPWKDRLKKHLLIFTVRRVSFLTANMKRCLQFAAIPNDITCLVEPYCVWRTLSYILPTGRLGNQLYYDSLRIRFLIPIRYFLMGFFEIWFLPDLILVDCYLLIDWYKYIQKKI